MCSVKVYPDHLKCGVPVLFDTDVCFPVYASVMRIGFGSQQVILGRTPNEIRENVKDKASIQITNPDIQIAFMC